MCLKIHLTFRYFFLSARPGGCFPLVYAHGGEFFSAVGLFSCGSYPFGNYFLTYAEGLDGLSLIFIILSTFIFMICVLSSAGIYYKKKLYFFLLFLTEFVLVNLFIVEDLVFFYILFETVLIPVFLIIGIWGTRPEKITAGFQFYIYTLTGSLFMLIAIIQILTEVGTTDWLIVKEYEFPFFIEKLIWISFFLSFAVKIPMYPFHLWLLKAHVEAPTAGSVLLAGILLKLGFYGLLRFSIFLFPAATIFFKPLIILLALIGIIASSFSMFRQDDLKRIVAYSSIGHMNIGILGCFSHNMFGMVGSIILMVGHGLVSAGLFLCIGYLYARYGNRHFQYFRDLMTITPAAGGFFICLFLANIGFPLTVNFVGELLVLGGVLEESLLIALLIVFGLIFTGAFGFTWYTRMYLGQFAITRGISFLKNFFDMTEREALTLYPLIISALYLGISPGFIIKMLENSIASWGI